MNEINISAKLTELRTAKGITQEEVAKALEVSNKTISKWENGTSSPELSMLAALAKYYNVSTDMLLGLKDERKGMAQVIADEFKGLDRREVALKISEIIKAIFPASYDAAGFGFDDITDEIDVIPPQTGAMPRYQTSLNELFNFAFFSDDVNLAVIQFRNKANFSWLLDEEKQSRIIALLTFLANRDSLRVLFFIHSTACSESFTAEYIAKNTGVPCDQASEVLEKCCQMGICSKAAAHLKGGDVTVYKFFGDGLVLSIISLAYERMCGRSGYNYNYNGSCKMIGGKKL